MCKISVFVPVYNEEKILEKNIIKLNIYLKFLRITHELFIVDDASTDSTSVIGKELAEKINNVKYLRYNIGPSRRENLTKSFYIAKGRIILFLDVDLSTDIKHLSELIGGINEGYDIVIGSRYVKGAIVTRNLARKFLSIILKFFIKFFFNSKINDHQCGFKAFKKEVIINLINKMGFDKKNRRKFFWDTEMLIRAQRNNYKIKEIPVEWKEGEKRKITIFSEKSMIFYMFLLKYKLLTNNDEK